MKASAYGVLGAATILIVTLVIGIGGWFGYGAYRCGQHEERLRNLIFQDVQQSNVEANLKRLKIGGEIDLGDMKVGRRLEMEELMQVMLDSCGENSVDTALRRAAAEDYGL